MTSRGRPKSVAIVGAGPSGLVTAKELIQEGHLVTCFEKSDALGGVFRFRPDPESVGIWESCRLTSSILVTSFSDQFPGWEQAEPYEHRHWTHQEYTEYLESYAERFGLVPHIRFLCDVSGVTPLRCRPVACHRARSSAGRGDRQRLRRRRDLQRGESVPHVADFPGLGDFRGQVLHAAHYRNPASVRGRSAVFIGGGESGSEIVGEASRHLERAYLSLRRGVFVIPRLLNGFPNDYTGTRLLYSLPEFVSRRSDAESRRLKRRLSSVLLPFAIVRHLFASGSRLVRTWCRQRARRAAWRGRVESLASGAEALVRGRAEREQRIAGLI